MSPPLNGRTTLAVSVEMSKNKDLSCLIYRIVLTTKKSLKVSDFCHCPLAWLPWVEAPVSLPLNGKTMLAVLVGMAKNKDISCLIY